MLVFSIGRQGRAQWWHHDAEFFELYQLGHKGATPLVGKNEQLFLDS